MENELSAAQNAAYDYQRCARVWQRVVRRWTPIPTSVPRRRWLPTRPATV